GERSRAAWQPSPVPSSQQPAQAAQQSSGSAAPLLPSLGTAPALGGAVAGYGSLPLPAGQAAGVTLPGAPTAADYIPIGQMFTTDRLEAAFDGGLPEQRGEWREVRFHSRSLGREVTYLAWLPPGYDTTNRAYPTLYLLHGVGGGAGFGFDEWLGYALTEDLDRLLALGLIEPMIVVLPNGEQGYWMNHADGGPKWADYVARDLVAHVDATYRTVPQRQARAVGGLSMGAHGALQLALNYPEVFGVAGAHSPTLRPFEDSPEFFGNRQWFAKYDPLSLAKSTDAARRITTWIDVGNDDRWRTGTEDLVSAFEAKKAPVTYRVLEGEHEGWYWMYYLPEYLNFYSSALNATAKTAQGAPVVAFHPLGNLLEGTGIVAAPVLSTH
ncbi:MAG: alpha/beta hydrolase, partial [Chloroflexota bacterium]